MKYPIDKELKSISIYSGSMVGRLYPLVNKAYGFVKCKSDDNVTVKKYSTPGYDGAEISALVIEPKQYEGDLPCIVLFHGGGFLMRASGAHYQIAKWYAQKAKCKVVMPDYRLLPKYRYPVAIEDCYNAYTWVLENAETLDINRDKILVAGDSAGGNIAGAVTLMLNDRGQSLPKGALLIYPVLDKRMITDSMKRFTDTPIWDSNCNKLFWGMYLKDQDANLAKYASIAEADSLGFFPPAYIEVSEYDCLHDEGIEFAQRLETEGISVEVHDMKGTCHGYETALKSSILEKCMAVRLEWIRKIFEC
ncbi:MAG: alpha/beta hydrolase [Treponema sp.]|nr:alpha/beta hydrolase [Treponema sp.]